MKRHLVLFFLTLLVISSCSKDDDNAPSSQKGLIKFKPYPGLHDVIYSNNQVKFIVEMQLSGSSKNVNVDIDYHLFNGSQKINEGKVRVDNNVDGGLGMFWSSDEHAISIDANAMKGKTLTVLLDPDNKYTNAQYTTQQYVDLYKKGLVVIP